MENKNYNALHLRAEGEYVILEMEVNKKWITLMKERLDEAFSHIIEPLGIEKLVSEVPIS